MQNKNKNPINLNFKVITENVIAECNLKVQLNETIIYINNL